MLRVADDDRVSRPVVPRLYPLEPLVDYLGDRMTVLFHWSYRTRRKYTEEGLTVLQADLFATRAGVHPSLLWPTWFDDALTENDRRFVWEGGWRQAWEWEYA